MINRLNVYSLFDLISVYIYRKVRVRIPDDNKFDRLENRIRRNRICVRFGFRFRVSRSPWLNIIAMKWNRGRWLIVAAAVLASANFSWTRNKCFQRRCIPFDLAFRQDRSTLGALLNEISRGGGKGAWIEWFNSCRSCTRNDRGNFISYNRYLVSRIE